MLRPFSVTGRAAEIAEATAGVLDVLVVGLGATGAGVALDAASRGLSVAAVDRGDLASGTSSKSSKLVHGGLRYLENYEFSLVREGVVERQLLQRLAPHLVRPMDFLYPVWPDTSRRRLLGLGLSTYDAFALAALGGRMGDLRRHARLSADEAIALAPALARSGLAYSYLYGDSATDDARLVMAVTREARRFGALTLTYSEVTGLHLEDGQVAGAIVTDRLDGGSYLVRARHVVNATGVWVDRLLGLEDPSRRPVVQPSKGVHVVVPRERLPLLSASILLPSKQGDGRSMFAIPWGQQTILGTTDTPYDGDMDDLSLTEEDLSYVLAAGNAVFDTGLVPEDVLGAWAGVRPLLRQEPAGEDQSADPSMSDLSRRHSLLEGKTGLVTITGGKLTTYRRMARDVVDLLVKRDGKRSPCRTGRIRLGCSQELDALLAQTRAAAAAVGLGPGTADHLVHGYGDAAVDVLGLVADDPSLGRLLSPAVPDIGAQVVYAARSEGAVTLEDVLARRTRVSLRAHDAGLARGREIARLLAAQTGRDEAWADAQVAAYAAEVRRERGVVGLAEPASSPSRSAPPAA